MLWKIAPYIELVPMFLLNLFVIFTIILLSCKTGSSRPSFIFMANLALADSSVFVSLLVLSFVTKNWAATSSQFVVCWEQPILFEKRCTLEVGVLSFCLYCSLVSLSLLTVDRFKYIMKNQFLLSLSGTYSSPGLSTITKSCLQRKRFYYFHFVG